MDIFMTHRINVSSILFPVDAESKLSVHLDVNFSYEPWYDTNFLLKRKFNYTQNISALVQAYIFVTQYCKTPNISAPIYNPIKILTQK